MSSENFFKSSNLSLGDFLLVWFDEEYHALYDSSGFSLVPERRSSLLEVNHRWLSVLYFLQLRIVILGRRTLIYSGSIHGR